MQGRLGGLAEKLFVDSLAVQNPLCLKRAPGPGAYTTQGDSDVIEFAAVDHGHDRRGGEGKFVGSTVTQLEIDLLAAGFGRWERHRGDEFARLKNRFALRCAAGDEEEISNGHIAFAFRALDVNGGFEGGKGDVHVGGVGGDAVLTGAQDGERTILAFYGRTAGAGGALVAGHGLVAEIHAAGALQQIAAGGGHVAQLRGGALEQGLGKHGVIALDGRVMSQVGVAYQRADFQAAVGKLFYLVKRKAIDVNEPAGTLDVQLHQVEQGCSAGDEFGLRLGTALDGLRHAGCLGIGEHLHGGSPMIAGERPVWQRRCWGRLRSGKCYRS